MPDFTQPVPPVPQYPHDNDLTHTHIASSSAEPAANMQGETHVRTSNPMPAAAGMPQAPAMPARTVIRRPGAGGATAGNVPRRRLVGFLVTYNRTPEGRVYNIYEGRNFIGRDPKCDVAVTDDNMMSSTHMSILYRSVDNKFKFRDEQSSNGTYVNKELLDDGELHNYDIIRVGGTIFIFMSIPQV